LDSTSLRLIPADAAFYSTMLRTGEQLDALLKSKAFAKVKTMPGVKMLLQQLEGQLKQPSNPQLATFLQLYKQPENQELVRVLGDMFAHEVFIYGGESVAGFVDLVSQLQGVNQYSRVLTKLATHGPQASNTQQAAAVFEALADNLDLIRIPDLIIGFRLSNTETAQKQLNRLEALAKQALQQAPPPLQGRFKREQVANSSFLTVNVDGSLVPWEQVNLKQFEDKEGQFDKLQEKLKQLKLTVSLGIRDHYLLLVIGESTAGIAQLGTGKKLADRPEFQPLTKHADSRLTSISYISEKLRARGSMSKKDIERLVATAKEQMQKAELPAELRDKLGKDMEEFAKDAKSFIVEPGAVMGFAFLTDRGQESFTYDWSQNPQLDATKPLTILNHLGGAPLVAVAGRSKPAPENYDLLVKWLKKANGYFEEFVLPRLDDNQKALYDQVAKIVHPLLERLDRTTRSLLLPAMADGQSAFVVDSKLHSKQWHPVMPASDRELPMLEPAIVIGVSDSGKLRKAFSEYRTIVNELIAEIHKLNPMVPDFQIPEPETRKVKAGEIFYFPLPEELGLDKQLLPNAGLSDKVAVLTASESHSNRLLTNTPLQTRGGPLADLSRPLAGAAYLDWAGLITTLGPWIHYGGQVAMDLQQGAEGEDNKARIKEIVSQVDPFLELLKCFKGYSSATYVEDKALVTHGEMVVADLKN
jgi:hypothetical protein